MWKPLAALALLTAAAHVPAAERACDQSESRVTVAPGGARAASVQHQVCETDTGGVAAAITVFVGDVGVPLQGARVAAIGVPRSHEEWPRPVWRSATQLEVWVPNFARVLETRGQWQEVGITLRYCHDDPAARAAVARHEADLKDWMQAVSRWAEARKKDPAGAGPRPERPSEPRVAHRPCTEADITPQ